MFWLPKKIRFAVRSPKWPELRKQHITEHNTCAACGRNKKLEVHHIEPVHINPDRELDPSNLITLCDDPCHLIFGHLLNYKSWNKNVVQDSIVYLDKVKKRPHK